ncbi:MAG TPA: LPS-assembly protein LptD [Candidatus Aphodousia faecigallinarum]|uniref:LPS-assembly protein LptD n=1 Tax=Candidatus Aphodousia faecigallinarum TaxID=2840677 RepID=A0A9D1LGL1_9BURK|nr:LPS-assembly protein LptD [Candidatus Aphodousia faecigallinarum]
MSDSFPYTSKGLPALKLVSVACALACASLSHAQTDDCLRLRTAASLSDAPQVVNDNSASFISADQMETTDDQIILTGDAEVRRARTIIRGNNITYTQSTDTVDVKGDAVVLRDGVRFAGPELNYQIETETGEMQDASYAYPARRIQGKTKYARFESGQSTQLRDATLSTCKPGSKAWWIQADTLTIDETTNLATVHDASFHLAGLPVMGLPYAFFPVGTERQSGLLAPTISLSSDLGLDYAQPIYWNIAPNYDYTFTPRLVTKRGVILGNEFRFLTPNMGGTLNYDWMPHDRHEDESRYGARVDGWAQWNDIRFRANYNRVSDGDYLDDFSGNLAESDESVLPQDLFMTYGKDFWHASLSVQKNQVLNRDHHAPIDKPYEKVPQFAWNAYYADFHGFEISSTFEATKFKHKDEDFKPEGDRFYMQHSVAYPMRGAAWFVTPKAMITGVSYNLTGLNNLDQQFRESIGYEKNSQFIVPTFSLDTGLIFERDASWFGTDATQTFEPRLFYVYTPYRDQSKMPVFDSSYADLSFGSFFMENEFTGHDRVSEANQVSLILTSRYLDRKTGFEWLRASIGQRFYFSDQDVALNRYTINNWRWYQNGNRSTEGLNQDKKSDYLGNVTAHLTKDVVVSTTAQYSTDESRFTRINAGIRWQPKSSAVMGLYYRYDDLPTTALADRIKQIDFGVQWPLTNTLYGLARYNYALDESKPVEMLAGIEYVADCWALRLVGQRTLDSEDRYDTTFFIQLELTGLGSVGSDPIEDLRRAIPGYRPTTDQPGPAGLYDYYE